MPQSVATTPLHHSSLSPVPLSLWPPSPLPPYLKHHCYCLFGSPPVINQNAQSTLTLIVIVIVWFPRTCWQFHCARVSTDF